MLGQILAVFLLTHYYAPVDSGPRDVWLHNKKCQKVAKVSYRFYKKLHVEGSGRLRDGRYVNRWGRCGKWPAYKLVKRPLGPGGPLVPYRSVAADRRFKLGTRIYVPSLVGMKLPDGSVHDGCVVVHDRGGGVKGRHIDLYVGTPRNYKRSRMRRVKVVVGGC